MGVGDYGNLFSDPSQDQPYGNTNFFDSPPSYTDTVNVPGYAGMSNMISPGLATSLDPSELPTGGSGSGSNPIVSKATGSILQRLFGGSQPGQNMADISSVLGGLSSGEKANRIIQGGFTQNYDRNMLAAQAARDSNEMDALKKLNITKYLGSGGSQFKPPTLTIGGKTYQTPDLGYGPTPSSAAQKAGASALESQLVSRLSPGGSYQPQPLDDYAKPGLSENIGTWGAVGTGMTGALANIFGLGQGGGGNTANLTPDQIQSIKDSGGYYDATGNWVDMSSQQGSNVMNGISKGIGTATSAAGLASKLGVPGFSGASGAASAGEGAAGGAGSTLGSILGKAVPLMGAGLGAYGLIKGGSTPSNIMNGVGTGASIGTMFGGPLGAGIGAGVGALAGWLRGMGGPSQTELQGRDVEGTFEKSFGGFQPMMDAIGKGYAATGHSSAEAQADAKAMLDAEKSGGTQTGTIIQQILAKMGKAPGTPVGSITPTAKSTVPNQSPNFIF